MEELGGVPKYRGEKNMKKETKGNAPKHKRKKKENHMEVIRTIRKFWEEKIGCSSEEEYELVCEKYTVEIGSRIRSIREDMKYSQDEFGMLLGLSQAEVSYLENGARELSSTKLYILNLFLIYRDRTELLELFTREDDNLNSRLLAIFPTLNNDGLAFLCHMLDYLENNSLFHTKKVSMRSDHETKS